MNQEIKELAEKLLMVRLGGYTGPNNNSQLLNKEAAKKWYGECVDMAKVIWDEQQRLSK